MKRMSEDVRIIFSHPKTISLNSPNFVNIDGVGGKAGMMKLGSDALVLTRSGGKHIVGMISVTMHEQENLDEIVIPMVEHEVGSLSPTRHLALRIRVMFPLSCDRE